MSTRATYQIEEVTFYIHYDGYQEGAAGYFLNMIESNSAIDKNGMPLNRGGPVEAFIRGNRLAEFTESHDLHGDTEFEYTLKGTHLTVRAGYGEEKRQVYSGELSKFVNKHLPGSVVEPEKIGLTTRANLDAIIQNKMELLQTWTERNLTGFNFDSLQAEITELRTI